VQTEEQKQFRLNPQVLVLVAVALLALGAPVAMVILSVQSMTKKSPPATAAADSESLRIALEDIAAKTLAPSALSDIQLRVEILADDPAKELARIEGLLKIFQAAALPPSLENGAIRLLVTVAQNRTPDFIKACKDPAAAPGEAQPVTNREETRALLEIMINKKIAQ